MGAVEAVALVVDALLVTAAVLAPGARARGLATVAAALLTPALLVNDLAASDRLDAVTGRPLVLAAGGAFALVVLAAGAVIVTRRPALLALAAVVAMPFRVPLGLGGGDAAYLLVPLYGVIGVGVLASAARELRGREFVRRRPPGALEWLLLGFVTLYAVQAS